MIPTTGATRRRAPVEPWNGASPRLNTPPSEATSQYPWRGGHGRRGEPASAAAATTAASTTTTAATGRRRRGGARSRGRRGRRRARRRRGRRRDGDRLRRRAGAVAVRCGQRRRVRAGRGVAVGRALRVRGGAVTERPRPRGGRAG